MQPFVIIRDPSLPPNTIEVVYPKDTVITRTGNIVRKTETFLVINSFTISDKE